MSYKKGYEKAYKQGLAQGVMLALERFSYGVEMAGRIGKKQYQILSAEIIEQQKSFQTPQAKCCYSKAWAGECGSTEILDNGQCEQHQGKCSCGKLATHECSHAGQFVCGRPLCDDCRCKH